MKDMENKGAERDAKRTLAGRPTTSSSRTQAVLRHLGVEFYRERQRTEDPDHRSKGPEPEKPSS